MSLLLGRVTLQTGIVFGAMSAGQMMYIFGLHLMAIQLPKKIHQSAKPLLSLYCQCTFAKSLFQNIRLANIIQMLHCKNQYGFQYSGAQLVTMGTFVKVG